ncbi:unnamed protein product [Thlaspi arvense]|uniref:Phytocyanin domain-containing protein n=1 Tax=Thlaspi arvense TaxID=13288 RepID=A0AAU9S7C8_THLAR|nr:unnamed protein product [Thlaspi arvense]
MFGGVLSVPVNNPHSRKTGSKPIITNLGENYSKSASMLLGTMAKLRSPVFLKSVKVALYIGGLYVCGKIGWESVMKMGIDTRELFFYETFLYYNPLLLITMMVWLWGVNLWVFSRSGVDYAAIFYLGPDHLSHKEIWKIVLYFSAVIILIIPFDIFYMPSRYYLLWTFWRILFPVQTVTFSDFFLADILTSMSKVLSDLERSVCRMVHRQVATVAWFEADSVCGSHSAVIPLVLVLPYLFRLFQCIRQYKDSKDIANIWNAGKYLTAVPVIFLSALKYFINADTWTYSIQPAWILFGLANTFFSFFWDVLRDWDLSVFTRIFKFTRPNICSHLLYGRRWVYVWVIGSNLVLRWTWTYKLSAHLRNNYITVFIITALEIYRRFQWAFFRIENVWNKINKPKRTSHQSNPVSLQNVDILPNIKEKMASREMQIIISVLATTLIGLAVATDHTIGGPSGWTVGANLRTWAAGQTFAVGDNLVFAYPSAFHDVVEVTKPEFESCQAVKPLITFANGNSIVPLTTPGKRYFICGMPGHCTQGMKLEVNVIPTVNAASTAPLPNAVPSLNAPSPSSVLPVQPLLPLNPVVPVLSPSSSSSSSSTPLPSSSLPLIPAQSPALSPAAAAGTSLPLFPGSPVSSSSTTTKTVGSFPSSATGTTTADLSGAETPPVDSSSSSSSATKSLVLGFGFMLAMMLHLF